MSIIDHRQAVRPASSLLIGLLITRGICGYAEVSESKRETRADIRASECERILRRLVGEEGIRARVVIR